MNPELSRRTFLKGLLAISAAAVVLPMLPAVVEAGPKIEAAVTETPYFYVGRNPLWGRFGRFRLGDVWRPLNDASITMRRIYEPMRYERDAVGHVWIPEGKVPLVSSSWEIEFWTPDDPNVHLLEGNKELEFEIDAHQYNFLGKGVVCGYGAGPFPFVDEKQEILYSISLEGDSKLMRYPSRYPSRRVNE